MVCPHCKKSGSHKPENCWNKFGKQKVVKDKRDRSASKERHGQSGNIGRRQKPKKSPSRARKTRDSETDRDSEAPSDTDTEDTPPRSRKATTRKVREIMENSARRVIPKKKEPRKIPEPLVTAPDVTQDPDGMEKGDNVGIRIEKSKKISVCVTPHASLKTQLPYNNKRDYTRFPYT